MPFFPLRCGREQVVLSTLFAALTAMFVGCGSGESNTNPRPRCPPDADAECVGPTGGGTNPTGGSTGSSGSGSSGTPLGTNDVTGSVGVLLDSGFNQASPYVGAATIRATSQKNMPIEDPYGDMKKTFTLLDVMPGPTWFFVEDQTVGATGIFSTFSVVNVPTASAVTLPVVDRNVSTSIAANLPSPIVVDGSRGVVVLKVVRNGKPLPGVSLTTALPGAVVAYDQGVGVYSNEVQETGPAGVIVALNVDGPATSQLFDLTLTDVTQQSYFIQVRMLAGAATFAGFEL